MDKFIDNVKSEIMFSDYAFDDFKCLLLGYCSFKSLNIEIENTKYLIIYSKIRRLIAFLYENLKNKSNIDHSHLQLGYWTKSTTSKKQFALFITIEQETDAILNTKLNTKRNNLYFLMGAFLACGNINSQITKYYHFGWQSTEENKMKFLFQKATKYYPENNFRMSKNQHDQYMVYIKKSEYISDWLTRFNCVNSMLKFEDERILRDYRVNINRTDNINISNQVKSIKTSEQLIEKIKKLKEMNVLKDNFTPEHLEIINFKFENPDLSYEEQAKQMLKLNKDISKSKISYVFKKIQKLV